MQRFTKRLDDITKYLTAAILLAVPLYPKFPFIRVPGTFVSIRLEDFLVLAASVILLLHILPNPKRFVANRITRAMFLFLLVGLVSVFSAIFVTKTVAPHLGVLHWLRRVEYLIPFFLGFFAIKNRKRNLEFYLKVLMIVVVFTFIYGFGQKNFEWPVIITQNQEYAKGIALRYIPGGHINSTFAGHYDLATSLVLLLPLFISGLLLVKGIRTKAIFFVVTFFGLWLLSHTGSRISTVSYLLATTCGLILIKKYKVIPFVLILSLVFFSTSSNLVTRYGRLIEVSKEKLQEINKLFYNPDAGMVYAAEEGFLTPTPTQDPVFEDRSTAIRLNMEWPRAIRAFSKNPILGTGYSSITLATDNEYLRLLGEVGVLGFFAFFLIF
ncbi:MAG: O-antigen ligase family protein, partial [Microgenomates group bacterium]